MIATVLAKTATALIEQNYAALSCREMGRTTYPRKLYWACLYIAICYMHQIRQLLLQVHKCTEAEKCTFLPYPHDVRPASACGISFSASGKNKLLLAENVSALHSETCPSCAELKFSLANDNKARDDCIAVEF